MSDGARGDGRVALSDYETKLVVAALCRYARASDVHDVHRERCERLAGALAAESSVTLRPIPGRRDAAAPSPAAGDAGSGATPGRVRGEAAFRWGPDGADG